MITLFLMGLLGATLLLGAVPFVAFALMLETVAERSKAQSPGAVAARRITRTPMETGFGSVAAA